MAAPAGTTDLLLAAISGIDFPSGDTHAFVARESATGKALRQHLTDQRGVNPEWARACGYWLLGVADAHEPPLTDQGRRAIFPFRPGSPLARTASAT